MTFITVGVGEVGALNMVDTTTTAAIVPHTHQSHHEGRDHVLTRIICEPTDPMSTWDHPRLRHQDQRTPTTTRIPTTHPAADRTMVGAITTPAPATTGAFPTIVL